MAMLHPLQLVCKSRLTIVSRYLTKFLVLLEELVDIIPPCRPCVWLLKREALSWLEHNSIDLSGGTVRTPANIVCWFLIFYKEIFQVLGGDKSHVCIHFYFLELFMILVETFWTSTLGWFAGNLKVLCMWLPLKIILL